MAIYYSVEGRGDTLYFIGEGTEQDLDQNKQVHHMIVQTCEERDCTKVLIDDTRVKYTASIVSLYELAKYYNQIHIPNKIRKVALVANPDYKESNDFYETTTRNRGVNLRVFHQREEAEAWLAEEPQRS
jgi:hypothetical protein